MEKNKMYSNEEIINYLKESMLDTPTIVQNNIILENKRINSRFELETIKDNITEFLKGNDSNRLMVLPGIRGVGKTTLLYETYDYLIKEKNISPNQILYFSCDEINKITKCDIKEVIDSYLYNFHDTRLVLLNKPLFILIDEAQYDSKWSLSGKIIFDKTRNIFLIITGSSALTLEYNADAARRMTKKIINPLTYGDHIRLKYKIKTDGFSEALQKLIFERDIDNAIEKEEENNQKLIESLEYNSNDWNIYLKYGGFPVLFEEKDPLDLRDKLVDIVDKIVTTDMAQIKNISEENRTNSKRVLRTLSLQVSNEYSQNKLAKKLQTSSANIKTIMDILEKTHLIFHCESHGTSSNRSNKTWKYYFATSSLKNVLSSKIGNPKKNTREFEGVLLENLVASTLYNTSLNRYKDNILYYDSHKKGNVDFILDDEIHKPIPIEVGLGKKDKKQIKEAINSYDSDYGIIVSNTTTKIKENEDIIYIPYKTFSFL